MELVSEGIQAGSGAHFTLHQRPLGHNSEAKRRLSMINVVVQPNLRNLWLKIVRESDLYAETGAGGVAASEDTKG